MAFNPIYSYYLGQTDRQTDKCKKGSIFFNLYCIVLRKKKIMCFLRLAIRSSTAKSG